MLVGAMLVTGGWTSMPAVAFAGQSDTTISAANPASATAKPAQEAPACSAATHTHSSSCGCAHCTAARDD